MGKFVIKVNEKGNPHFNLLATNGQVIGTSEVYNSMAACKNGIESVKNCCGGEVEDTTEEGYKTLKHPKFVVKPYGKDRFKFDLKAKNGQVILSSQGYESKKSCLNGIESIKKNAPEAPIVVGE